MIAHPIQLLQSRFILQNRLPNFYLYKNIAHFIRKKMKKPSTFAQGWQGQIVKNIVFSVGILIIIFN